MYSPTLRDRNDLLRESEKQFKMSDESAYSIVPSCMSMSIYTRHTTDSGASKSEESLVYKPLTFEDELFTARVYKRNYRTPAIQRFLNGTGQKPSDKNSPRTVTQEVVVDHFGSEAEHLTIVEPRHSQRRPTKAQSATLIPTKGHSAWGQDTSGQTNMMAYSEPPISFDEACRQGNDKIVERYLASGLDVHVPVVGRNHVLSDLSAILDAAQGGHVKVVEILLSYGADKETVSFVKRRRPLHLAVKAGHVAMVQYLLDNDTDIAAADKDGAQAIHLAVKGSSVRILSLLLERGAAIDSAMTDGARPLHLASKNPDGVEIIKFLCSQGADIEARTNDGHPPLSYARRRNAVDNMEALLELGAAHSPQGLSILTIALSYGWAFRRASGCLQATRCLLEHGMDPNIPVSGRRSALHAVTSINYSMNYRSPEDAKIIELLLDYGADVNLQDSKGDTPLHCLCRHSQYPIIQGRPTKRFARLLSNNMRDVDTVNFAGRTALGVSMEQRSSKWLSEPLIDSGSRLLLRRPHLELRLSLHQSSDSDVSYLDFYVRQGSNMSIKRLGNYPEDFYDDELGYWTPMVELGHLLQDPESLDLNDGSWVSCDDTTPLPHRGMLPSVPTA